MKKPPGSDAEREAGNAESEGPVEIPIEDSLDLHTFQPREVKDLLDDYLEAGARKGICRGEDHSRERHRNAPPAGPLDPGETPRMLRPSVRRAPRRAAGAQRWPCSGADL